jgi:hypothetical protein
MAQALMGQPLQIVSSSLERRRGEGRVAAGAHIRDTEAGLP